MAGYTMKDMTTNFGKLDKFEGHDFRRWQKKMHFLLTTLKVVYVLTTPISELVEDATVEAIRIRAKWENDDYICKGHILNCMSDSLFDVCTNVESAKELWDSLESKYMVEDSSSKKFLVSNFNNYKMVDSRPVMEQYNELLRILRQYTQHGLKMDESISVSSIIDKLPPSWKDFKHTLKHGKDDLSLVQLGSHLRIEESLRAQDSDKGKGKEVGGPSVNMTEEGKNKHNKQNKGKKRSNENNSGSSSNKKPKLECWKCGKTGHFKRDCRSAKKNNANAGGSGKGSKDQSQDQGQNLVPVWNNFVKELRQRLFKIEGGSLKWMIVEGVEFRPVVVDAVETSVKDNLWGDMAACKAPKTRQDEAKVVVMTSLVITNPLLLGSKDQRCFRVKDVRRLLDDMLLPKSDVPSRWVKQIPIKVNVLAWKISMDRLPTRVNLHRRGVQVSPISCPICCEALENLDHLLFCCDLAKDIARFNQVQNKCWKECFTLPGGVSGNIETISSSLL
ncbi:zinc finger, CCHC-type containing protein [Tanacetum coccineum]